MRTLEQTRDARMVEELRRLRDENVQLKNRVRTALDAVVQLLRLIATQLTTGKSRTAIEEQATHIENLSKEV